MLHDFGAGRLRGYEAQANDEDQHQVEDNDAEAEHPARHHPQELEFEKNQPENEASDTEDKNPSHHSAGLPLCGSAGGFGGGSRFSLANIASVSRWTSLGR